MAAFFKGSVGDVHGFGRRCSQPAVD